MMRHWHERIDLQTTYQLESTSENCSDRQYTTINRHLDSIVPKYQVKLTRLLNSTA
jgi:hypothetical protein